MGKVLFFLIFFFMTHLPATAQTSRDIDIGIDVLHGDDDTSLRARITYAHQITPKLSAGIGTGYIHYDDPLSLLPLFFDLRYAFSRGDTAPFIFVRSGYSFSILTDTDISVDEHNGGWLFNPGIGIQLPTKSGPAFYFSAGYNLNHSSFENEISSNRIVETNTTYKRLMIGVGLLF